MRYSYSTEYHFKSRRSAAKKSLHESRGFTLVELLIAASVFSVLLIVITFAIVQISRSYSKGIVASRTQESARAVIDEVSKAVQFGAGDVVRDTASATKMYCIGGKSFSFELDKMVDESISQHALMLEEVPDCTGAIPDMSSGRELLANRMRLTKFEISTPPADSNLYEITVGVVSGEDDIVDGGTCDPNVTAGTQFCAVSELTTQVQKRAN